MWVWAVIMRPGTDLARPPRGPENLQKIFWRGAFALSPPAVAAAPGEGPKGVGGPSKQLGDLRAYRPRRLLGHPALFSRSPGSHRSTAQRRSRTLRSPEPGSAHGPSGAPPLRIITIYVKLQYQ